MTRYSVAPCVVVMRSVVRICQGENIPVPQGVQEAAPEFEMVPAGQALHVDATAGAKDPAAQVEHWAAPAPA